MWDLGDAKPEGDSYVLLIEFISLTLLSDC